MPDDPTRAFRFELQDLHRDLRDLKEDLEEGLDEIKSWLIVHRDLRDLKEGLDEIRPWLAEVNGSVDELSNNLAALPRAPAEVKR